MRLKDYFDDVRKMKLDESQKMAIFERFVEKSYKQSLFKRWSFYVKVGVYTVLIIFFIYSFFPIVFYQPSHQNNRVLLKRITSVNSGIYVETTIKDNFVNKQELTNKVYAKDLGKILYVKGDFLILRDGKQIKADKLLDGDYVILKPGTNIKFKLNNGLYGKISGPAKFQIEFLSGKGVYVINLLQGYYCQLSADVFSGEVKIKTDDVVIVPVENKNLNVKILQRNRKKIVENIGNSSVVIEKTDKKIKKTLRPKEIAKVNGNIEIQKLIQEIKQGKIKTYTNLSGVNTNILNEDIKLVPSVEQINELSKLLYPKFLEKDTLNLINYWSGQGQEIAIKNLMLRILKIYDIFDLQIDSAILKAKIKSGNYDIDDLFLILDQLISKLQKSYYIEPKFVIRLKKLEAWILLLKKRIIKPGLNYKSLQEVLEKNNLEKFKAKLLF